MRQALARLVFLCAPLAAVAALCSGGSAQALIVCPQRGQAAVAEPTILVKQFGPFQARPAQLQLGDLAIEGIGWSLWSNREGRGSGTFAPALGPPSCRPLPTVALVARLHAYRPLRGRFTRLALFIYTAGSPARPLRSAVLALARSRRPDGGSGFFWRCLHGPRSPLLRCLGAYPGPLPLVSGTAQGG